jgi:hypothetical protein
MGQRFQTVRPTDWRSRRPADWRSGDGHRLWLSMLVATMEEVSRPEFRALPCEPSVLMALGAQLARPAAPYPCGASSFSLRN